MVLLSLYVHYWCMDKTLLKNLAKRIRELRESKGVSQEAFASQISIARSFYGCIERGEKNISVVTLIISMMMSLMTFLYKI